MYRTDEINELAKALVAYQKKAKNPEADKENPHFKSKFSSLGLITSENRTLLAEQGLTLLQEPINENGSVGVRSCLMHSSGQYIEFDALMLTPSKNDPQGAGSAITYARRYATSAILGLATEEDDDGNAASKPKASGQKKTVEPDKLETMRNEIKDWLLEMSGGDKVMFSDLLEMNTEFTNAKGELVRGKRDLKKVSDNQLPVTHRAIKGAYETWKGPGEEELPPLADTEEAFFKEA